MTVNQVLQVLAIADIAHWQAESSTSLLREGLAVALLDGGDLRRAHFISDTGTTVTPSGCDARSRADATWSGSYIW